MWNSAIAAARRLAGPEARADGVAPQLVEEQTSRGRPRTAGSVRSAARYDGDAAAEVVVDEGELGREHRTRVELDLLLEHEPLEHDALGDVAVADRPRERRHRALVGSARPGAGRRHRRELVELADRQRRINRGACRAGAAAEARVAHPEVDADRLALVPVDPRLAERRPAPRPDRVRPSSFVTCRAASACSLTISSHFDARLQPLAPARARRRLELELERDAARRNPDLGEARGRARASRCASPGSRAPARARAAAARSAR